VRVERGHSPRDRGGVVSPADRAFLAQLSFAAQVNVLETGYGYGSGDGSVALALPGRRS
jgi:hypothetical protein